jgi:hypothetical protein
MEGNLLQIWSLSWRLHGRAVIEGAWHRGAPCCASGYEFQATGDFADDFAIGMQSEPDDRLATPSSGFRVLICSRI